MFNFKVIWLIVIVKLLFTTTFAADNYTCTISTNNAAFGTFNPLNYTSKTISVAFSVRCSALLPTAVSGTITFSYGNANSFTRIMKSGTYPLSYNIYKDSGCTQILGDGTGGTYTFAVTGNINAGSNNAMTASGVLYGRIPSQPNSYTGNFSDNVTMTLTYQ